MHVRKHIVGRCCVRVHMHAHLHAYKWLLDACALILASSFWMLREILFFCVFCFLLGLLRSDDSTKLLRPSNYLPTQELTYARCSYQAKIPTELVRAPPGLPWKRGSYWKGSVTKVNSSGIIFGALAGVSAKSPGALIEWSSCRIIWVIISPAGAKHPQRWFYFCFLAFLLFEALDFLGRAVVM